MTPTRPSSCLPRRGHVALGPTTLSLCLVLLGGLGWFLGRSPFGERVDIPGNVAPEATPTPQVSPTPSPSPDPGPGQDWPARNFDAAAFAENWRAAWQSQDLPRFMGHYADYIILDGKPTTRERYWNYHARENAKQPRMEIGITNLWTRAAAPTKVVITFAQHFQGWGADPADNWDSVGSTTLVVEQLSGNWKITRESYKRSRGNAF